MRVVFCLLNSSVDGDTDDDFVKAFLLKSYDKQFNSCQRAIKLQSFVHPFIQVY